mgnify:CR=1 FL=1
MAKKNTTDRCRDLNYILVKILGMAQEGICLKQKETPPPTDTYGVGEVFLLNLSSTCCVVRVCKKEGLG